MAIILMSLEEYAEINNLDLDEILEKYGHPKNDVIVATDLEKFKKKEEGEDEE